MIKVEQLFKENEEKAFQVLNELALDYNYQISPKTDKKYLHIDYGIFSPVNNDIVKECRGIVLDPTSWDVVRYGFYRFMNWGDSGVDSFSSEPFKTEEKADGSIIILWYSEQEGWVIGTRGRIFSDIKIQDYDKTFGELFVEIFNKFELLDVEKTYIFELCSPYNRVVVFYEPQLVLIGARDKNRIEIKDEELDKISIELGIRRPKVFEYSSFEDILKCAKTLPGTQEGFIVKQWNNSEGRYNRAKIKGDSYKDLHMIFSAKSLNNLVRLVIRNDRSYFEMFPEYMDTFDMIRELFDNYEKEAEDTWESNKEILFSPNLLLPEKERRKLFAQSVMKTKFGNYCFLRADGKIKSIKEIFVEELKVKNRTKKYIDLFQLTKKVGNNWKVDVEEEE